MFSVKSRIRSILIFIAIDSWIATLLSLLAINRMIFRIEVIVSKDVAIVELGERVSIGMLEARRDEKNFIIYFDSTYLKQNHACIDRIINDIQKNRPIADEFYLTIMDSLEMMITHYSNAITLLSQTYQEDPRTLYRLQDQIRAYEKELRGLAQRQKFDAQEIPALGQDFGIPLLSAAMKVSSDQARLFNDLRETSTQAQKLAQEISMHARAMLAQDASKSVQYGLRAQKWIFILLIIAGLFLSFLIVIVPKRIFYRFHRLNRAIKAIGRGETDIILPVGRSKDEIDELAENFGEAIERLKYFNNLKTEKIIEVERNLRKIIDEVDESIFILSPEMKITHMNRAAQIVFNINNDAVYNSMKNISILWEQLGDKLEQIEKNGRTEMQIKVRKRELKKHQVMMMPIIGLANRLESVVIFIR